MAPTTIDSNLIEFKHTIKQSYSYILRKKATKAICRHQFAVITHQLEPNALCKFVFNIHNVPSNASNW